MSLRHVIDLRDLATCLRGNHGV